MGRGWCYDALVGITFEELIRAYYDWIFVGTSVTIKLVLVYVKVTTPPETVLVSVIGQREVEVV